MQGGDINLYETMRCHGVPLVTISRGRVVYENGVFMCAEGTGKFCPLRSFPDSVYKKLVQREKVGGWDGASCALRCCAWLQGHLRAWLPLHVPTWLEQGQDHGAGQGGTVPKPGIPPLGHLPASKMGRSVCVGSCWPFPLFLTAGGCVLQHGRALCRGPAGRKQPTLSSAAWGGFPLPVGSATAVGPSLKEETIQEWTGSPEPTDD